MGRLITQAHIEARISKQKLTRLLDDTNTGEVAEDALDQAITDAESRVFDGLTSKFTFSTPPNELTPETAPDSLRRLALDFCVAYLAQRHPEVMRQDWKELMKQAEKDLTDILDGKISIAILTPTQTQLERPAGDVFSGLEADPDVRDELFSRTGYF